MQEIKIYQKQAYGTTFIYPACAQAKLFAKLIGKKTFSLTDLGIIMQLGYIVTTVTEPKKDEIPY